MVYSIYKIVNDIDEKIIYIGSTESEIKQRFERHLSKARGKYSNKFYDYMREKGIEHFQIDLLEETKCQNKEEAIFKENEYIEQFKTNGFQLLNTNRAYTTPDQKKQQRQDLKKQLYIKNLKDTTAYKPRQKYILRKEKQDTHILRKPIKVTNKKDNKETVYKSLYSCGVDLKLNCNLIKYYIEHNKEFEDYKFEYLEQNMMLNDDLRKWLKIIRSSANQQGFSKSKDPVGYKNICITIINNHKKMIDEVKNQLKTYLN